MFVDTLLFQENGLPKQTFTWIAPMIVWETRKILASSAKQKIFYCHLKSDLLPSITSFEKVF